MNRRWTRPGCALAEGAKAHRAVKNRAHRHAAKARLLDEQAAGAEDMAESPGAAPPTFDLADMVCPRCTHQFSHEGIDHADDGGPTITCSSCGATYPTTDEHHAALQRAAASEGSAEDSDVNRLCDSRDSAGAPRSLFDSQRFREQLRREVRKRLRPGTVGD